MFFANNVAGFRHLLVSSTIILQFGDIPCVYFEDLGDIISLAMDPYQNSNKFATGVGETVHLAAMGYQHNFIMFKFFLTLQTALDLRFNVISHPVKQANFLLLEKNAILLKNIGMMNGQLLPYSLSAHQLYFTINDVSYSSTFFLKTFQTSLWLYFIWVSILIFGCFVLGAKMFRSSRIHFIDLFDFISLILGNSIILMSSLISFRLLLLAFLILLIIFYAAFEALLDVLLAIKNINLPFHSFTDLLSRKDYTLCAIKFTTAWEIMEFQKKEINGKVMLNSQQCPQYDPTGYFWINDYTFQCNSTKMAILFVDQESQFDRFLIQKCNMMKFPGKFFPTQVTFLRSIEFSFKQIINQKIIKVMTSGNMHYIINTKYPTALGITSIPKNEHTQLEIEFEHCKLIILLLIIGMIASFVFLTIEIIWKRRTNRRFY